MNNLQIYRVQDYRNLYFQGEPYNNHIDLKNIWDNGSRTFLSTPALLEKAVLLNQNDWFQMHYNSIDALADLIKNIPSSIDAKFVAAPEALWGLIKNKWPELHFNNHYIYQMTAPNADFSSPYSITPLKLADLDFLSLNQPYIDEYGGKPYLKHRIKQSLTAGIRHNNELLAWEIFHDDGTMGFLRVREDYRRKGLASVIQTHLASRLIKLGINAICYSSHYNSASVQLMQKVNMEKVGNVSWIRRRSNEEIKQYEKGIF